MGKISRTWSLMSDSWGVLRQHKSLLVFPLMSGFCCLLLLVSFAIPIYTTGAWRLSDNEAGSGHQALYYGTLFCFYLVNYFIVVFFNSAIVACAAARMNGDDPTLGDGLRAALSRLPVIAGWALVSATVGLVLRMIEDRSEKIGRIVAGLLGMGWTVVSFLVVPVLVVENQNPIAALKSSTVLLKKTWGEQLASHFSFGMVFFVLAIPAVGVIVLGLLSGSGVVIFSCIGLAVIYLILLGLVQSALQAIFQTALYLYARDGKVPEGFRAEILSGALS
ncbi:MAG: DUF6159 family protein [Verrucomicrobiota bacterium]